MKIFISYDYHEDRVFKNLLIAWSKNNRFNLDFEDNSVDISVNSMDEYYIKQVIKNRIRQSDIILCLVGKHTYKSEWVKWELDTSFELGKRIVAVKIDREYNSPKELLSRGVKFANSFNFPAISGVLYFG